MRKDVKKCSFYVWFLGVRDGGRGPEGVIPAIRSLVEREREVEPMKVTLQASRKGLKIVRFVGGGSVKELVKRESVSGVYREEDIVACTVERGGPPEVQAYRCDSRPTAALLAAHLNALLRPRPPPTAIATELKERLASGPLLLPPRDYPPSPPSPTTFIDSDPLSTHFLKNNHSSSDDEWSIGPRDFIQSASSRWGHEEISFPRARKSQSNIEDSSKQGLSLGHTLGARALRSGNDLIGGRSPASKRRLEERRWKWNPEDRQRSPTPPEVSLSTRERFIDAKEKFLLLERDEQEQMNKTKLEKQRYESSRSQNTRPPRLLEGEKEDSFKSPCLLDDEGNFKCQEDIRYSRPAFSKHNESNNKDIIKDLHNHKTHYEFGSYGKREDSRYENFSRSCFTFPMDVIDEVGAKSQTRSKEYIVDNMKSIPLERYRNPPRLGPSASCHLLSPNLNDFRDMTNASKNGSQNCILNMYDNTKKRPHYGTMEEEVNKNSNELANELKRKSLQEAPPIFDNYHPKSMQDSVPEYSFNLEREIQKAQLVEELTARFRHSWVEPVEHPPEHLQNSTNSVSTARIGIAALHPY